MERLWRRKRRDDMVATRKHKGLAAWLAQERVFRLIPFILVEGLFITLMAIPFLLTIYISLLRWRANRPFEQAVFSGLINFEAVLYDGEFWASLGRTFGFATVAVSSNSCSASAWPCSWPRSLRGAGCTLRSSSAR